MEEMSKLLVYLRQEKKLSQKELADRIGISQSTIAKLELGRNEATAETIRKLSAFFNVSADYLLGKTDDIGAVVSPIDSSDPREKELLSMFRQMNTAQQNRFLGIAEGMIEESKKNIRK